MSENETALAQQTPQQLAANPFDRPARNPDAVSMLGMTFEEVQQTLALCEGFATTGFFFEKNNVRSTKWQLFVKGTYGRSLGLDFMTSLSVIYIVEGKPCIGAHAMASAIKGSAKYDYRVTAWDDQACVITFLDRKTGENIGESSFTWAEAVRARLTNKDNWQKYPKSMLLNRAVSMGYRAHCPDAFNGQVVYTDDELEGEGQTLSLGGGPPALPARRPRASREDLPGEEVIEAEVVTPAETATAVPGVQTDPVQEAKPSKRVQRLEVQPQEAPAETETPADGPDAAPEAETAPVVSQDAPKPTAEEKQARFAAQQEVEKHYTAITGKPAGGLTEDRERCEDYIRRTLGAPVPKRLAAMPLEDLQQVLAEMTSISTLQEAVYLAAGVTGWFDLRPLLVDRGLQPQETEAFVTAPEWVAFSEVFGA